ncbi:ankyrin repeat-containing domain protein [Terfezia claveryi]|nr:ankyrin repeat-containing domain protein [Terfezia claveryi]
MATSISITNGQTEHQQPLLSNGHNALLDYDPADLNHPLLSLIATNDLPSFHSLLPNTPPSVLTVALNLCLRNNKPSFIPPLLTHNVPFNRHTALEAIRGQNPATLSLLLSPPHSMSPHGTSTSGHMTRPIELALRLNNIQLVSILLAHGADIDSHEFEVALTHSSSELVKRLIETSEEAKYQVYRIGALQIAAGAGNLEMVEFLLGLPGMSVDGRPRRWGKGTTALMEAVGKRRVEVVGCLLMNGADPELGSGDGEGSFKKPVELARELEDGDEKTEILELLELAREDGEEQGDEVRMEL